MQCDRCNKDANIEIIVSDGVNGERIALCFDCYQDIISSGMDDFIDSNPREFLKEFIPEFTGSFYISEDMDLDKDQACPKCGKTMEEVLESGVFGCNYCYSEFEPAVHDLVQNVQGSTKHIGLYPKEYEALNKIQDSIHTKRLELEDSVMKEDYEQAAQIKEKIDELTDQFKAMTGELDE